MSVQHMPSWEQKWNKIIEKKNEKYYFNYFNNPGGTFSKNFDTLYYFVLKKLSTN